jgi:DNA-binding transcriptional ArsR family regulator
MTETQLSNVLGLTRAAIGYHLNILKDAKLIEINRYETEEHGISKYYSTTAKLFIVDPDSIPEDAKRYFIETQIMHLEGMLSVFKLYDKISEVTTENLEDLAKVMLRKLKFVGQKYVNKEIKENNLEFLRIKIYAEVLDNIIKEKKYKKIFNKK